MTETLPAGDCSEDFVEDEDEVEDSTTKGLQSPQEMMALLPAAVKRRVKALKLYQYKATLLEAEFYKEVHKLECSYHEKNMALFDMRSRVVNAEYEPNDAECEWPSDPEDEELAKQLKDKIILNEVKDVKGIPLFWLTVFKHVGILSEMMQPHDEPILAHLKDIQVTYSIEPMGFTLFFKFEPNDYFTNTELTKQYFIHCVPEKEDPFSFEGPEIYKCVGCDIDWNKGKNVTLKTVKKKQKHKSRGVVRTVTKTMKNDSFFNFFDPPVLPEETKNEDVDEDLRELMTNDFEIGHYIKERVIPKAVLYFTGELEDDDDFDEEDEEEEDNYEDIHDDTVATKNANNENCKQQ